VLELAVMFVISLLNPVLQNLAGQVIKRIRVVSPC